MRKDDHLKICLTESIDNQKNSFADFKFIHNALPEIDFKDINIETKFLNKKISAPLIISAMTGGANKALVINKNLALAAQALNIPLMLGSARDLVEKKLKDSFQVRKYAPIIPLLANLGAVQLNYGFDLKKCQQILKTIQADALVLHLNSLQEAIQKEGNTNFKNLLSKIKKLNQSLPVIIKEVGSGISGEVASKLKQAGIKMIDVAGSDGTNWALIEGYRENKEIGQTFASWGISTCQALKSCSKIEGLDLIAGGGIRSGLDIAKSIALGARYASLALPLLKPATLSASAVREELERLIHELKIAMFCLGAKNLKELSHARLYQNPL